jgi:hypothetical protein
MQCLKAKDIYLLLALEFSQYRWDLQWPEKAMKLEWGASFIGS